MTVVIGVREKGKRGEEAKVTDDVMTMVE